MNTHSFSITEAISFGFRMFVRNFWLLIGLSLVGAAVQFGAGYISKKIVEKSGLSICQSVSTMQPSITQESGINDIINTATVQVKDMYNNISICLSKENMPSALLILLIHLLALIFGFVLLMGWNRIALDLYDRGTSEFNRIFVTFPFFLSYLIAGILYSFVTTIGFFLLIIPGIVWGIKYSFFDLMIVDTGCGPVEALSKSGHLTYGHKWQLFLFTMIYVALIAISVITIVGPFILAYILFLSRAYIFRTLQGKKHHA